MQMSSMAIFSNPLFATYSVYARNASISIVLGLGLVGYVLGLGLVDKVLEFTKDTYTSSADALNVQNVV